MKDMVAEIERIHWFQGWVHFCVLALITVNFCSIFKNKVSKSKLKFFYPTKHNLFIYLVSKLNNTCTKLCTFLGHPVVSSYKQRDLVCFEEETAAHSSSICHLILHSHHQ